MMFFQKRWVAWTLCVLVIFASTLLNTRWKLGARCAELTESFYSRNGISAPLSQMAADAEELARLAQNNGVDGKPLQALAESLETLLGQHEENARMIYADYDLLRGELSSTEQKLLSVSLSSGDAAEVSACLERIRSAREQISASDYNAQVQSFQNRYDNGFTRLLANLAGVKLPVAFA